MVNIRNANCGDSKKLAEVYSLSWAEVYKDIINETSIESETNLEKREKFFDFLIQNASFRVFTIEKNNERVGVMVVIPKNGYDSSSTLIELVALYIHPDHWRSGIGTYAITFLKELYKNDNADKLEISLWVLSKNISARNFYEKNGFFNTKTFDNIKFGEQIKQAVQYKCII